MRIPYTDYGSSLSLQQLLLSSRIEQIARLFDPGREILLPKIKRKEKEEEKNIEKI